MPHPDTWLQPTPDGLFCAPGGFFIDPVRPVDKAIITHAHSDHARPGHGAVLASPETMALMDVRMGPGAAGRVRTCSYKIFFLTRPSPCARSIPC